MAAPIAIPKLGMAMTEATLVTWHLPEAGRVEQGQVVLTIETEKTTWEVEAPAAGWLHIVVPQERTVPVARVVGLIAESEEELARLQREPAPELMTTTAAAAGSPAAARAGGAAVAGAGGRRGEIKVSPLAKKLADEHGLDLAAIAGTGPGGRIVREDVERAIAEGPPTAAPAEAVAPEKRVLATIPVRGMRRSIGEHMQRSLAVSAQLTFMGEAEMSGMVALRGRLLAREAELGARVTYTDLLVVAIARALADVPILNSSLVGDQIKVWEEINVGVAVALEGGLDGGLIVPVVRDVPGKSLGEISREIASLAERARAGRLLPDDVADGTFTLTNLAAVGGGWSFGTPIINQPQSAILASGAISDRAVVREGEVVVRAMMPFSLTIDHRVVDGAPAARFANRLTELLAGPEWIESRVASHES